MTSPVSRIIVCGGRNYRDRRRIREVLREYVPHEPVIVHGAARGADQIAANVAMWEGLEVEAFPANWCRDKKAAGPIRNRRMAQSGADLCIAFPGGKGTADMVRCAREHGIPVRKVDW